MRLGLGFARQRRDVVPGWVDPGAVLAMQFGPDRYWRKQGGILPATSVLSTTRSSGIILPNAAGDYQSLGNNTLPRTSRGLYANGQSTRLNADANFNPTDTTNLASRNSAALNIVARGSWPSSVEAAFAASPLRNLPVTSALRVTCPGAVVNEGVTFLGTTLPANTQGIASAFVFVESGATPLIGLSASTQVLSGMPVVAGFARTVNPVASSSARVMAIATDHTVAAAASTFWVILSDIKADTFATPPIASPAATLFASDIRAVQGVRPSNGQPEPFAGWEAAGLDDGFTVLMDLESRPRNPNGRRAVFFVADAGENCVMETNTAGGNLRLNVGTTVGNSFPGGQVGGRTRAAFRLMADGSKALAQQGSGTVNDTPTNSFGTMRQIIIGNQDSLSSPWNDWIYELQVCKPLTNEQLLAWVNA